MILDDILKQASAFLGNYNDDAIDRLHYLYSAISLSIYLIFITSKQYYGEPIQCVFNSGTQPETIKYIHSMCWLNGTYYVEEKNGTMADFDPTTQRHLNYYQWIVFILLFQVFLFRLPSNIWAFFIDLNGFELSFVSKSIMHKIYQDEYLEKENWMKTKGAIEAIGEHLRLSFLKQKFQPQKQFGGFKLTLTRKKPNMSSEDKAKFRQSYPNLKTKTSFPLFIPYLLVKLIYIANVIFNFSLLSAVFGFDYTMYGIEFVYSLITGRYQFINKHFPKRSACYLQMLSKQADNQITVICSLPINLINEYFYAAYWYWLVIIGVATTLSIFYWFLLIFKSYRRRLVLHALQLAPDQNIQTSYTAALYFGDEANFETADAFLKEKTGMTIMENFDLFFTDVCSLDVVFVLKLISFNSSSLAFRDILNHLWEVYLDIEDLKLRDVTHRPIGALKRPTASILGTTEGSSLYPRHHGSKKDVDSEDNDAQHFMKN